MGQSPPFRLMASRCLPANSFPENLEILFLEDWIAQNPILWVGRYPLYVLVAESDMALFLSSVLGDHFAKMNVTVIEVEDEVSEKELVQMVLARILEAMNKSQLAENALRSGNAALRVDYMQLQQSFVATEDFLYNAFAPSFICAREWPPYSEPENPVLDLANGPVSQRLPVGSKGLVAVDVWMTDAGDATLTFGNQNGVAIGPSIQLEAKTKGWVRAQLDKPLDGLEEDVWIGLNGKAGLALTLQSHIEALCAGQENRQQAAPLAMRIWKGLPGVRVPEMKPGLQRHIVPASEMPDPEVLGDGRIKRLHGRDAFSLHPAHDGKLDLVFRGVDIPSAANVAVFVQNFGPETVQLSMSPSETSDARSIYLQAESHGQCDMDFATSGSVDIYVKLRAPSPVASVFIRGLEICPVVG